jgi:hypothetical protein
MIPPSLPLVTAFHILVAASGPPTVDIAKTCRISTNEVVKLFGSETLVNFQSCMTQQSDALGQIRKGWSTYTTADKSHCVQQNAYMPSYVEWLTCFEMEQAVRQIRAQETSQRRGRPQR